MTKQLVIQLARFGDIVQTRRLILSLQRQGEVHLCVNDSLEGLARLVYPGIPLHGLPAGANSAGHVFQDAARCLQELQSEQFDAVYALNHAGLCRAVASLFDPAIVRGYPVASGQPLRSNWVRLAFRWMSNRAEAPLNLVDFWAALAPEMVPPQTVNPVAAPGGRGLGVVLAGQNARRSLPVEVLAPVVRATFERLGGPMIYLLGSEAEQGAARRLLAQFPAAVAEKVKDLTGRTDWAGLADALSGLDAVLTPDTGTAHLAAHVGAPVEGLFLSSAWAFETGPYGEGHKIWQAMKDCSPCTESSPCGRDTACLAAFRSPPFLARMQGRTGGAAARPLEGMALLQSGFDELGEIWRPIDCGENSGSDCGADSGGDIGANSDPALGNEHGHDFGHEHGRAALRGLLAEYLGIKGLHRSSPASLNRDYAEFLYQEADWMLPQSQP